MSVNYLPKFWLLLVSTIIMGSCAAQPSPDENTTTTDPTLPELSEPSVDVSAYPWLHTEQNIVQFYSRDALTQFEKAWKDSKIRRFSIVMLGDSHLQTGTYPEQFSRRLRKALGDAGQGLMFPNSTVKMYSPLGYTSKHTGEWQRQRSVTMRPKMDMGLRGFTSRTTKTPASFTLSFRDEISPMQTRLRVFCKNTKESYDLEIVVGATKLDLAIDGSNNLPYVEISIPPIPDKKLTVNVVKKNSGEKEFELYGLSLDTEVPTGAIVHNAGVGAARYNSILYQSKFSDELPHFDPDLVIIDFGTNDYLYDDKIKPELESEIKKVIKKVRDAAPNASILLTTVQDLYWKGVNCRSAIPFSKLIHKIAKETNCGVYDWFWISGGQGTLKDWRTASISRKDMVHLSIKGSKLKGNLMYDAFANTIDWMDKNPNANKLVLPEMTTAQQNSKKNIPAKITNPTPSTPTPEELKNMTKTFHTVKSGESLSIIANKHGVSVANLLDWNQNNIKSANLIYVGDVLVIYKKK